MKVSFVLCYYDSLLSFLKEHYDFICIYFFMVRPIRSIVTGMERFMCSDCAFVCIFIFVVWGCGAIFISMLASIYTWYTLKSSIFLDHRWLLAQPATAAALIFVLMKAGDYALAQNGVEFVKASIPLSDASATYNGGAIGKWSRTNIDSYKKMIGHVCWITPECYGSSFTSSDNTLYIDGNYIPKQAAGRPLIKMYTPEFIENIHGFYHQGEVSLDEIKQIQYLTGSIDYRSVGSAITVSPLSTTRQDAFICSIAYHGMKLDSLIGFELDGKVDCVATIERYNHMAYHNPHKLLDLVSQLKYPSSYSYNLNASTDLVVNAYKNYISSPVIKIE